MNRCNMDPDQKERNRQARKEKYRERAGEMYKVYSEGRTLQEVGDAFGITRERVRQLFKMFGHKTEKYHISLERQMEKDLNKKKIEEKKAVIQKRRDERERIINLSWVDYEKGMSYRLLAEKYQKTQMFFSIQFRKRGYKPRPTRFPKKKQNE